MNIILTGATGFLGSNLLRAIQKKTNHTVIILKRSTSDLKRINFIENKERVIFYDIDKCDLQEIFKKNKIDLIIHCATEYGRSNQTIHKILDANILFPIKLIELAISFGVKTFINTDTYFNKVNGEYSNLLNYAISKKSLITWLQRLSSQINIINVRLEHIYGPNDNPDKFVEMLFQNIVIKEVERIHLTHGHQKRDFIFIDDVTNAYLYLIDFSKTKFFNYAEFEVGTGIATQVKVLPEIIKKLSSSKTTLGFGDIDYRDDEMMSSKADVLSMLNLGWKSTYDIEDGLKEIYKIYFSNISK